MDFSTALHHLKAGRRIARAGWNGKDMFLFLVPETSFTPSADGPFLVAERSDRTVRYRAHVDMKTAQGDVVPWVASQSDLLENDWEAFE